MVSNIVVLHTLKKKSSYVSDEINQFISKEFHDQIITEKIV